MRLASSTAVGAISTAYNYGPRVKDDVVAKGLLRCAIHRLLKIGAVHHSNVAAVAPLEPTVVSPYGGGCDGPYGPAISRC